MVLNFIYSFRDIIYHLLKQDKTDNQILSDIHLLVEEIKSYISDCYSPEKNKNDFTNPLLKSVEYNNALLLAALHPANIRYFLNAALAEKRYYFFSMVCDMILNSNLKKEYKKEVLQVYKEASDKLKISLLFQEKEICELIIQVLEEVLNNSMSYSNWKTFAISYIDKKLQISFSDLSIDDTNLSDRILELLVTSLEKY